MGTVWNCKETAAVPPRPQKPAVSSKFLIGFTLFLRQTYFNYRGVYSAKGNMGEGGEQINCTET